MNYLEECAGIYTQAIIGRHIHSPINMIFHGYCEKSDSYKKEVLSLLTPEEKGVFSFLGVFLFFTE